MLIVPELQATFIFPPRTGSDSLCVELMGKYPNAFLPYRHMEADGLPVGYETWRRVGFVRHPLARLWSLFKFCSVIADGPVIEPLRADVDRVAASVRGKSFEQWVLTNEELFLPAASGLPILQQLHHVPETRKSQEVYLRPDLGTVILRFQDLQKHMADWGLNPERRNGATPQITCADKAADAQRHGGTSSLRIGIPQMTRKLKRHLEQHFAWEMAMDLEEV